MTPLAAEEELQAPYCYQLLGVCGASQGVGEKPPYAPRVRPVVH